MAEVHDGATLRAALLEIASDFSFTWIAEARPLFDALDAATLRRAAPQPDRAPLRADRRRSRASAHAGLFRAAGARAGSPGARPRRGDVVAEPERPGRPSRRLLLGGVRARREPPHLLRRARRARRRLSQGRVRARHPARRDRALLPPRLLPPAARRARPAGRALPAQRPEPAAARARADGAGHRARGRQRRSRAGAARRLARATSGASRSTSSTRRSRGTPTGRATSPTPLRRRP